jgi:hypothetical protein
MLGQIWYFQTSGQKACFIQSAGLISNLTGFPPASKPATYHGPQLTPLLPDLALTDNSHHSFNFCFS